MIKYSQNKTEWCKRFFFLWYNSTLYDTIPPTIPYKCSHWSTQHAPSCRRTWTTRTSRARCTVASTASRPHTRLQEKLSASVARTTRSIGWAFLYGKTASRKPVSYCSQNYKHGISHKKVKQKQWWRNRMWKKNTYALSTKQLWESNAVLIYVSSALPVTHREPSLCKSCSVLTHIARTPKSERMREKREGGSCHSWC